MQTLQQYQTEYKTLTHCIARLMNHHPEYLTSNKHDEYLYAEVCRELNPNQQSNNPKMDTILRTARIIRKRRMFGA